MQGRNQIPQYPQKLSGSFWGMTAFFNPQQYKNKLEHYRQFRRSSQKQGLRLICVELAFGDRSFELTRNDADIVIQRRAKSVMWQKERLLNIALKNLPPDCDKVAWIDADIIFKNDHWIQETSQWLELYKVVQPFEYVVMLPKGVIPGNQESSVVERYLGKAYKATQPDKAKLSNDQLLGHPGFVWAARRDCLQKVDFYDKMVLGWGDFVLVSGFYHEDLPAVEDVVSPSLAADARAWKKRLYEQVRGSVYYASGNILHLWHGDRPFRLFHERLKVLAQYGFVPQDVRLNKDECWEWATWKPRLHWWVAGYFKRRNEEDLFWDRVGARVGNFLDFEIKAAIIHEILKLKKCLERISFWVQSIPARIKNFLLAVFSKLDWIVGQVGLFLKRHVPGVYDFLKGTKGRT